jgi:predicted nucleic acid-binding protein
MSIVYAESSAVLAWLLGEASQDAVIHVLAAADEVVTSALTKVECTRGLRRAHANGRINGGQEAAALRFLDDALGGWHVLDISEAVLDAAQGIYPREPAPTLDALHLASAVVLIDAVGKIDVLSFDERVRMNARELGMGVVPAKLSPH